MIFWRKWHRWLGTIAGVLLALVAATGIYLQVEEVTGVVHKAADKATVRKVPPPLDAVQIAQRVQALSQGRTIEMLRIESFTRGPVAVVRFAGEKNPVEINLQTGARKPGRDGSAPLTGTWSKVHLTLLMLHTFGIAGMPGHLVGGVAGVALLVLCGSGLWVWWVMRKERVRRNAKETWFWR